ncbi:uncharacterized protein LOC142520162 [Primulina tabacum]|uniref:uncharacterized protein LOC142520162 n=1 Tax=Primulina tabacum TaxID=48773 RepID=UPI003F5A2D94
MASNARTASYNVEEDKIICHVYLDITQNPITGINQSKDQFWTRVEEAYNITKPNSLQIRNKRSLQCRMKVVLRHIGRLRGCIRQIETLKPSGASEEDISEAQTPETPIAGSPALHSFSINLSRDENTGHHNLMNILEKGFTELHQHYDIQMLKLQNDKLKLENQQKKIETRQQEIALVAFQEENRVLYMDLSTIGDPEMRKIVRIERAKIMRKRERHGQQDVDTFGKYLGDFGGSGSNLPDY